MAETIRENDPINECATILRNSLLSVDFGFRINGVMHTNYRKCLEWSACAAKVLWCLV